MASMYLLNNEKIKSSTKKVQYSPFEHKRAVCNYQVADRSVISKAIEGALASRKQWEELPFEARSAVFLKAADLLANKYQYGLDNSLDTKY
jgi:1-pyrroline-5-carboxylate dehydrogenase